MKKGVLREICICGIWSWTMLGLMAGNVTHADEMIVSEDASGDFSDGGSVDSGAAIEMDTGTGITDVGTGSTDAGSGITDTGSAGTEAGPAGVERGNVSAGDISGLFVDTGEVTVSSQGELLDDVLTIDGMGDGGSTVAMGHLYEINGVLVRNSDFPSEHYECWTYANNVYAKIWGHNFWNLFNDTENMLRNLPDEALTLTPEHLKAYVSAAPAGAALRVCDEQYLHADDGWGHSQIIISHDENGFTVFEGGLAAYPHRREAYYTWDGFCYSGWPGKYHYIKYIKWPGAAPYSGMAAGENAIDLGVAGGEAQTESASGAQAEGVSEVQTEGASGAQEEGASGAQEEGASEAQLEGAAEAYQKDAAEAQKDEKMQAALKDAVRELFDLFTGMIQKDVNPE